MWLELTPETTERAAERAREHHPKVRRAGSDSEILVPCINKKHPQGHITRFERRADSSLWGECVLRDTGEECPAATGRRVCHHLAEGAVLFLALEAMRTNEDRDGALERAIMFDGARPQPVMRRRSSSPPIIPRQPLPGETVREVKTLGGTYIDRRVRGIAI